tara:strand:- start:1027 stop:1239 length:213 start_codon:yes stop_codon:yes gene_type:complete
MGRKLSTWEAPPGRGYCEVHFDYKEEFAYIKYFDANGKQFFIEEFPNKAIGYVEDAAENWTLGIKTLTNM